MCSFSLTFSRVLEDLFLLCPMPVLLVLLLLFPTFFASGDEPDAEDGEALSALLGLLLLGFVGELMLAALVLPAPFWFVNQ